MVSGPNDRTWAFIGEERSMKGGGFFFPHLGHISEDRKVKYKPISSHKEYTVNKKVCDVLDYPVTFW